MMWVFAVLLVLAMGVIAMVAAGYGEPMSKAEHDWRPARLPTDRAISAEDLRTVRFPLAFRGYRMDEVDALLDRMARELTPVAEEPRAERAAEPTAEPTAEPADDEGEATSKW